eukprot:g36269.t1
MIPAMQKGDPQWSELKAMGVGWWVRNINTLRKTIEKDNPFILRKNPLLRSYCDLITKWVAMGTCMGPGYTCLFEGYMEQSLFRCYTGTIPHLFLCYVDDWISAASCSHEELEQFNNFTITFHPNLKFTCTISNTSLSFLDLSISIS